MRKWLMAGVFALVAMVGLAAAGSGTAHADVRDFTLYNDSAVTIYYVYVSPSDTSDWGDDVLGTDVLLPGDSVDIVFRRFDGTCYYDIKVVGENGEEGFLWAVDLCSTTYVTFS